MKNTMYVGLCVALTAFISGCKPVNSQPVVIMGNANGIWSPSHPHVTGGKSEPPTHSAAYEHSPVHVLPTPEPVVEPVAVFDVCPTLLSAPHLCPPEV